MSRPTPSGPVTTATETLLAWLERAGVSARVAPPASGARASGAGASGEGHGGSVHVWPLVVLPEQATRQPYGVAPLRLRVRYLLAPDPGEIGPLDRVLEAAVTDNAVHVALEEVTVDVWRGLQVSPRLGVYVDVPVRVAAPQPAPAPRVRAPLRLEARPLARLSGAVLGPGGVPLPGIRVAVPATGAATHTDNHGQFALPALPAGEPVRLSLSGRGVEMVAEVASPGEEPIVIHCEWEGD